jgi:hypothetical protein
MRILILEDDEQRIDTFRKTLGVGNEVIYARTYEEFVVALELHSFPEPFDLATLDHDLGDIHAFADGRKYEFTGANAVDYIVHGIPPKARPRKIIIHSFNKPGADNMMRTLASAGIPFEYKPFGS